MKAFFKNRKIIRHLKTVAVISGIIGLVGLLVFIPSLFLVLLSVILIIIFYAGIYSGFNDEEDLY